MSAIRYEAGWPHLAGDPARNRRRALLVRRARKLAAEGVLVVGAVPTCAVAGEDGEP